MIMQDKTVDLVFSNLSATGREELKVSLREGMLLLLSRFSYVRLCETPQTSAHQAPPSMGFSGQEYWSGEAIETSKSFAFPYFLQCN